ncbi:MAG: hypothetical protein IJR99_16270 [Kiritimatiellae bacterium]|nr:hypothetical protein [Kiritimatiellia bacterium]
MNRNGLLLCGIAGLAATLAYGAVTTNVWLTAAGGGFHDFANWSEEFAGVTNKDANSGFLDFRALSSGASVTLSHQITFSGFWFAPTPSSPAEEGEETRDGGDETTPVPYWWYLPNGQNWKAGTATEILRVDDGELFFSGKMTSPNIHVTHVKQGNGALVVRGNLGDDQDMVHNLRIDEGEVRIAANNALRHVTYHEDQSNGRLSVSNSISEYFIGRIYSSDTNREPDNLAGRTAHIGGAYADSVIAVPSTNGTYISRGHYTLLLGSLPEATELNGLDGDFEICTLTNSLRDCVGFWRFENFNDPLHDSGLRGNTLVASGTPQVVTDAERGNVLYLDGASYLTGRWGNSHRGIPTNNTPYTVAFWVKIPTAPANPGFAAFHWGTITGNKCNFMRFNPDGKIYHSHGDGSGTARNKTYGGGYNLYNGTWHHIVVIHDGDAQMRYYIDGNLVTTADWSAYGTPAITAENFQIGNPWSASSIPFVGYMDDFLILSHALNAEEIAALHAGQTDTPNSLPAEIAFQTTGNGALRLGGDQTFSTLRGETPIGGIRLQNGAMLTIDGGSPATTTQAVFQAGIRGNGSFRKDGANLDLVASSSFDYSGDTEIAAGSLTLRTANDLAAWWRFEDTNNLGYSSERVNALDVVKYNAAVGVTDNERGSVAQAPDGTSNGILGDTYTGHSGFPIGNSPYTCAVWVKRDADCPNNGSFFWWGVAGVNGQSVQFRFIDSYKTFALAHVGGVGYDFTGFTLSEAMPAGEWHHVAATYNGNKVLSVYYDGQLVKRETTAKAINIPYSGSVIVGKYSGRNDRTFKGLMDDARIYSRCLTDEEIAMLAAESGEPAQYAATIQLPQPVAEYTFDDPENPGKDTSGNGYDLTPVGDVTVTDSPIKGGMLDLTGTVMSYLKYADDAFPAKIPSGTKSFTIACWARPLQGTGLAGTAVAWGEAVTSGSHSTILDLYGGNNDRSWRFVTLNNNNNAVMVSSKQSSLTEGSDDLRMHHLVAVYDTAAETWKLYVDGVLSVSASNKNGCSTPASNFYVGRKPSNNTAWFRGELDEVRIYDTALNAAQVRNLVKYDLSEGHGVLPPSTTVSVAQNASLHVESLTQNLKGLQGAGDVTVNSNATLRLTAPAAFAGALTGEGNLALPADATFPAATLSGFTGTVVLEGGKLSGAVTPALCDARIPDGTALALADAPFAAVGGTLTVGGSGSFTWIGESLAPGDYPIATASDITLEQGDGWQASPEPGAAVAKTELSVRDNGNGTKTLLFRVIASGTIISIR